MPERSKATGEKYSVLTSHSLEAMFDVVDVVNICVPSSLHAEIGIKAAQAGKHVLVEKPIGYRHARSPFLGWGVRETKGYAWHHLATSVLNGHEKASCHGLRRLFLVDFCRVASLQQMVSVAELL